MAKLCQEDAPRESKAKGTRERTRVVEDSPEKEVFAGGHGGAPGVYASGLVAGNSLEWGQREEGVEGFLKDIERERNHGNNVVLKRGSPRSSSR